MRPNIFLGTCEGSTQYKKWYFEVMVDQVEPFLTAQPYHLRVGWALTEGYSPYPGGGEGWGGNGVGDDLYSYGFDGLHLWSGKENTKKKFGQNSFKAYDFFFLNLLNVSAFSWIKFKNQVQKTQIGSDFMFILKIKTWLNLCVCRTCSSPCCLLQSARPGSRGCSQLLFGSERAQHLLPYQRASCSGNVWELQPGRPFLPCCQLLRGHFVRGSLIILIFSWFIWQV